MRKAGVLLPLVIIFAFIALNAQSGLTSYPESLSGVEDAPGVEPELTERYFNGEFAAIQYGWPFAASETRRRRDLSSVTQPAILPVGALGNILVLMVLLWVQRLIVKCVAGWRERLEMGDQSREAARAPGRREPPESRSDEALRPVIRDA